MIFLMIVFIILLCIILRIVTRSYVIENFQLADISKWKKTHKQLVNVLEETDTLLEQDNTLEHDLITRYNNFICEEQIYYDLDNRDMNNMFTNDDTIHLKPKTTHGVVKSNVTHIVGDTFKDCRPLIANYTNELRCDLSKQPCLTYNLEEIIDYGGSKIVFKNEEVCKFDQCMYYCDTISNDCWRYDDNGYIKLFTSFNGCLDHSNLDNAQCYLKPDITMCPNKSYFYVYQDLETLQYDKIDKTLYDKSIDYVSESNMYKCKYTPHHSNSFNTYEEIINHCGGEHPSNIQCYYPQGDRFILDTHTFDLLNCSYNSNANCYVSFGTSLCKNVDIVNNKCLKPIDCHNKNESVYTIKDDNHVENVFTRIYQKSNLPSKLVKYNDYMSCEYPKISYSSYITNIYDDCKTTCYNPLDLSSNIKYGVVQRNDTCKIYDCYNYTSASNIHEQRVRDVTQARRIANEQVSYAESLVNDASYATTLANEYERQVHELENENTNHCVGNFEYVWTKDPNTLQEHKYDSIEQVPNSKNVILKSSDGGRDLLIEPLTDDVSSLTSFSKFNDTLWYYPWANYRGLCEKTFIRKISKSNENDSCMEVIEEKEGNTCIAIDSSSLISNIQHNNQRKSNDIQSYEIDNIIVLGHEYTNESNTTLSIIVSNNNEIFLKKNNVLDDFEYIFKSVTNIDANVNWIAPFETTFSGNYKKMNVNTSVHQLFVLLFKHIHYIDDGNRIESGPYRININLEDQF